MTGDLDEHTYDRMAARSLVSALNLLSLPEAELYEAAERYVNFNLAATLGSLSAIPFGFATGTAAGPHGGTDVLLFARVTGSGEDALSAIKVAVEPWLESFDSLVSQPCEVAEA